MNTHTRKARFAVIGAGWISQIAFLPAIAQTGNAEVVAIVSGDLAKARQLADFYGIAQVVHYDDFDALATSGVVDAVYIATPNSSHAHWALRAAGHGLHVLVEKPLAMTLDEAQAMVDGARKAGVFLQTAYRLHNDPATVRLTQLLQEGAIGDARACYACFTFQIDANNHRLKAAHWGGPLQDLGVYCVNAARHVFGAEPTEVMACAGKDASDARFGEVDADLSATLRFPGGRTAQFYCSFGTDALDLLVVQGTAGSIELRGAFLPFAARSLIVRRGNKEERFDFPAGDEFSSMVSHLSHGILSGQAPMIDATEGLADMQVLLALEEAAKNRRPVSLNGQREFRPLRPEMAGYFAPSDRKLML